MPPLRPLHHVVIVVLLLLAGLQASCCSAARDTVSPGNGLAGRSSRLISNNSKFALGFFKPDTKPFHLTTSNPNTYLGIWYNKVPKLTPLWTANGDSPVVDPASPELAISAADGNLVILDQSTKNNTVIWSTRANTTTNDTVAVLLNDGNLVLRSATNSSAVFWQSFDYPTDTFFAGAKIGWNKVTGLNRRLVSRKSLVDQSPGLYTLGFDERDGVGRLVWNNTVEIMSTGHWTAGHYFSLAPEMIGPVIPNFTFVNDDQEVYFTYTLRDETAMVLTQLGVDGQAFVGMWMDDRKDWLVHYRQPVHLCDTYATCGPFTVCDDTADPICTCIQGFSVSSPVDWELGDRSDGCVRNTPLDVVCGSGSGGSKTDGFYAVQGVRLPHGAETVQAATSGDDCQQVCLGNCSCTAYSYGEQGGCSVWHDKLTNVKQQQSDGSSVDGHGAMLYVRLAAKDLPKSAASKEKNNRRVIGAAFGASSAVVFVIMVLVLMMTWRRKGKRFAFARGQMLDQVGGIGVIAFPYADLQRATKNFTEKLGGGSFGSVFKGYLKLSDSLTMMAVKRLDGNHQGEKQFRAEVSSIGIIQHINLVKLIGFCCEGDKRLLVYEYMPKHSLDVLLFKKTASSDDTTVLDWSLRYKIAVGVGLAYLHTGCRDCIIHCDIKPENILLDTSFAPKIADFGMAKVLGREFSNAITTMRGTIGYLAPEWISGEGVTSKVDVYSYGMVLFELISGRRNSSQVYQDGDYSEFFPLQVVRRLHQSGETVGSLVDADLHGEADLEEVERVCKIACWCIQESELDRPAMTEVVQFLEGLSELEMPPVPRLLNTITGGSPAPVYYLDSGELVVSDKLSEWQGNCLV